MKTARAAYANRIVCDPDILVGKPTIKGTRVPVELVLQYLADTPNFDEFLTDYPELALDDVRASLDFAAGLMESKHNGTKTRLGI